MVALLAGPLLGWMVSAPLVPWAAASLTPRLLTGLALGAVWPLAAMVRHAWALHRSGAPWRGIALITLLATAPQGTGVRRLLVGPAAVSGIVSELHCEQAAATRRHPGGGCLRCTVRLEGHPSWRAACSVASELRSGDRLHATVLEGWLLGSVLEP